MGSHAGYFPGALIIQEDNLPTTKTAEKELRVANRREDRNKSGHSKTKTDISKAEKTITTGDLTTASADVKSAISALDKQAEKGKIHSNNAARRKSRLMKKLNQATAASKAEKKS
jgi:small subunit ribosomal protein S20